jgi:molybdopterin-guanine dinucleotide biosynthesis protein A
MAVVDAPHVLVVACDQPFLADGLGMLLDGARGDGAIAVDPEGRRQHLLSVLDAAALRSSINAQSTLVDLSVRALLAPLDLAVIVVPQRAALDIDTWHDHDKAQAQGARHD